jgi:hypothetical protein
MPLLLLGLVQFWIFSGSKVLWNGQEKTTAFVSNERVTTEIPSSDIALAGAATVAISNPTPGGGKSESLHFNITHLGPIFEIQMSRPSYAAVNTVTAIDFRLRNTGASSTPAEIKAWLEVPSLPAHFNPQPWIRRIAQPSRQPESELRTLEPLFGHIEHPAR